MRVETFDGHRTALHFDRQKINVHGPGDDATPVAAAPAPASLDI